MGFRYYGTLAQFELEYGISTWMLRKLCERYGVEPYMEKSKIYKSEQIEKVIRRYHFERDYNEAYVARGLRELMPMLREIQKELPNLKAIRNEQGSSNGSNLPKC